VVIAGVTGDYPSATYPLPNADGGVADLENTTYEAKIKSATQFEFFDSAGTRYLNSGDADIAEANIKDGEVIFDVTGTAVIESHSDCDADAEVGCVAVAAFMAADMSDVTEGTIKDGVVIGGVTGDYPSATYPLAGADGTDDLTSAAFDNQVKSATAFEYFDSTGARQTGAGDADIAAGNLKLNVDVFGVIGTYNGEAPDAMDIRVGATINGVVGEMKVNCRNAIVNARFNYDGLTSAIPNTHIATGTTADWWDTITDYNDEGAFPVTTLPNGATPENQWSADTICDEDNFIVDAVDGSCDTVGDDCTITDRIQGLMFSEEDDMQEDWPTAVTFCDNLVTNGYDDWRLPTQKELMAAQMHGIRALNWQGLGLTPWALDRAYWSATTAEWSTNGGDRAYLVDLSDGGGGARPKTEEWYMICVREP
jgi:hypothetical protein